MNLVDARRAQRLDEVDLAATLLGEHHPLVRALDRLGAVTEQSLAVAILAAAAAVAVMIGAAGAVPLLMAALVIEAVLVAACRILAATSRDRAIDVIIAGGGEIPLSAVQDEGRRLTEPRHVRYLADWLDAVRRQPAGAGPARPLFSVRAVAAVAPDLADVTSRLREGDAGVRGVARTERLLREGASPLYGLEAEPLRRELCRIRRLLGERP